jgi:hypothetical protein
VEQAGAHRIPAILRTSPRHPGDGFQRPLVPRFRFQPQLRPSVAMTSAVCAVKRRDGMSGKLRPLCREGRSRWGAALWDTPQCEPHAPERYWGGERRYPRGQAWLREARGSPTEAGFPLRGKAPLSPPPS